MNSGSDVITLLDRFTLTMEDGDPDVYSPWRRLPEGCRVGELVYECLAYQSLHVEISLETSIDLTSVLSYPLDDITSVGVQTYQADALGRYVRVGLKPLGVGEKPNMVLTVAFIPKRVARR